MSRSPEEDVPDVEAPQAQEEEESPTLPNTSKDIGGGDPSDSAPSPLASPEITVDDGVNSEIPAPDDFVSEIADLEALSPEVDNSNLEAAVSEGDTPSFAATAPTAASNQQSGAVEGNPLLSAEKPAAKSTGTDETRNAISGPTSSEIADLEALSPEVDNSNLEAAVSEGDTPGFAATAPTAASNRQSGAVEGNPLLSAEKPAAKSTGIDETRNAISGPTSSEIAPLIAEAGQFDQPDEASNDAAASAAAPARFLETPGELTITLESIGWIFRSDRSTPGAWRFLGRENIGNSTSFRFLFSEIGKWDLVFERQNLSGGESEEVVRRVAVSEVDDSPGIESGPLPLPSPNPISGTPPADADARYLAALGAVEADKIDEAIKYYEQDASRNDSAGVRARSALVETAAKFGTVGPLLTWLPRYLEDNPSPEVLREALEVFSNEAGYDNQSRIILEKLGESGNNQPEWIYRLALLLEKPGEERDLDRATHLYQEVINGWPLSEWRDLSEERLLWLQRHYFRIR